MLGLSNVHTRTAWGFNAYMWFNLAAAQGQERLGENAPSAKDLLEEEMTRAQIAEGQRLSREWLEAHPSGN